MSQDILLPLPEFIEEGRLCLVGKLTNEESGFLESDKEISEKRNFFSILIVSVENKKDTNLVGIYADEFYWECIFDEFEKGVMINHWEGRFQRICQLK